MRIRTLAVVAGSLLLVAAQLSAQTTSAFHAYGYGCATCVQSNEDALTNPNKSLRQGTLPNEYAYGYTAPSNIVVHGFAMYTQTTTSGTFSMGTALYQASATSATTPDAVAATTGTMTADSAVGWYVTEFATPVAVANGANFWVSGLNSSSILASSVVGGSATTVPIYWRRTGNWALTGIISNPGIVIFCERAPILSASNTPKIPSTNFSVDIANAAPLSPCFLILGVSDTTGPLGPLPSDLGILGFTKCVLFCSNEFTLPGFTTTNNDFSWSFPIPNIPTLDGVNFYTQSYVADSVTSRVSFSNAGKGLAGTN